MSLNISSYGFLIMAILSIPSFLAVVSMIISRKRVYFALAIMIISTTVAKETINFPVEVDAVAFLFLVSAFFLSSLTKMLRRKYFVFIFPLLGYLVVNYLASYLHAPNPSLSFRQSTILVYRVITFYLVIMAVVRYPSLRYQYPKILQSILALQFSVSFLFLIFQPTFFLLQPKPGGGISIKGFFQESNLFGIYALCVTALSLAIIVFRRKPDIAQILFILIGTASILLSYTRSTWLGMGLVLGFLGFFVVFSKATFAKKKLLIGTTLSIPVVFLFSILTYLYSSVIGEESIIHTLINRLAILVDPTTSSAAGRLKIWSTAIESWTQNIWIGWGPLSYAGINNIESGWLYNFIIQSLHDSGLIGTMFLLIFYAGCLFYCYRGYRSAQDMNDKGILLGFILAQFSLFFTSLFSSFTWGAFAWVLSGLAVGYSMLVIHETRNNRSLRQAHNFTCLYERCS